MKLFKPFIYSLYIISFAVIIYSFFVGLNFYGTDYIDRPHHDLYDQLKPSGFLGHGYGIVGTAMM